MYLPKCRHGEVISIQTRWVPLSCSCCGKEINLFSGINSIQYGKSGYVDITGAPLMEPRCSTCKD